MKKRRTRHTLLILTVALLTALTAVAQSRDDDRDTPPEPQGKPVVSTAWTVLQPLGLREPATIDTMYQNYSRQAVPSMVSDAYCLTGNLGAEGQDMIWMNHRGYSEFFFVDALRAWLPQGHAQKWYNTAQPMTLLSYNTGGGKENGQDRLRGIFSGNINKKAQVGAMLDYLYSKGSYANQSDKDLMWGFNGSYMGDRFEFQGFYNHYNALNKENGGIVNDDYVKDPEKVQAGITNFEPRSIPTRLTNAHTRVVGGELMLNSRYKVGYWHEEADSLNDTIVHRTYIPVTSFIWTLNYSQARHIFTDDAPGELNNFFQNTYLDPSKTYDKTTYWRLRNTFGISMLEGFHKYAKFGLAAYVTHEIRKYHQTPDTLDRSLLSPFPAGCDNLAPHTSQNLLWVGGQLTKQRGSLLTYEATAQFGLVGPAAGDVTVDGHVATRFPLLGDSLTIKAYGRFNNEHAPFLLNQYLSNHFIWKNDFGKERTFRVGGVLTLPRTGTSVDVGVENVQNRIYFGPDFLPVQHGGSVQVFWARAQQDLSWRALHWDNRLTYQTSGDDTVIPLPKLAWYSNLYVQFRIATLHVQFGLDCDYYTSYYSPLYQPATMSFANQRETKVGNYPFMNLYANMKLSKARFYVQMSHINQGIIGGNNYFSMPGYPLNPRRLLIGVSVDFAN